jgi:hypothetical protein
MGLLFKRRPRRCAPTDHRESELDFVDCNFLDECYNPPEWRRR